MLLLLLLPGLLALLLQLLDPRPCIPRDAVLECAQIVNVPHGVLAELPDVHAIREPGQLDVVVVSTAHNEFLLFTVLTMRDLHNVDAVDDPAVDLNVPGLPDVVRGEVHAELVIGEVPHLHVACGVSRDEPIVVLCGRDGRQGI